METLGSIADKLMITNIRIWFAEDIKRNSDSSNKQIADATRVTNIANQQRNDLIQEFDEMIIGLIHGKITMKSYKQGDTKMYGKIHKIKK